MIRPDNVLDCLIVGGGPAGLAAAIYLARFRRRLLLVDAGDGRCVRIPTTHNLPGFPEGVNGRELLERMRRQALRYDAKLDAGRIEEISAADGLFTARDANGRIFHARTVLMATGVRDQDPPMSNAGEAVLGGVVRHCPICDAYEAAGRCIAILSNGSAGVREALFLKDYSEDLTVLATSASCLTEADEQQLRSSGIALERGSIAEVRLDGSHVAITFADGRQRSFEALYAALGSHPQLAPLQSLGVALAGDGRLATDAHMETSIPGLFAAGDNVSDLNQIAVAMGHAAIAAARIHNRLREAGRDASGA